MSLEFVCKYVDAVELSKANEPAGLFESFCDVVFKLFQIEWSRMT